MWLTSKDGLLKIRSSDGAPLGTFHDAPLSGCLFDGQFVWAADTSGDTVYRFAALDGSEQAIPMPKGTGPMSFAMDNQWQIYVLGQKTVVVIDHNGNVIRTVNIGYSLGRAAFDAVASVWVTLPSENGLARISAVDGSLEFVSVILGKGPMGIAYDGRDDALVIALSGENAIAVVPISTMVAFRHLTGVSPVDVACGETYCWSVNSGDSTVTRYRIADWLLQGTFSVGAGSFAIALDGAQNPWVVNAVDVDKR